MKFFQKLIGEKPLPSTFTLIPLTLHILLRSLMFVLVTGSGKSVFTCCHIGLSMGCEHFF